MMINCEKQKKGPKIHVTLLQRKQQQEKEVILEFQVKKHAKARKLQRKIKKLTGVPVNRQELSLLQGDESSSIDAVPLDFDLTRRVSSLLHSLDDTRLSLLLRVLPPRGAKGRWNEAPSKTPTAEESVEEEELEIKNKVEALEFPPNDKPLLLLPSPVSLHPEVVIKLSFRGRDQQQQHRRLPFASLEEAASFANLVQLSCALFGLRGNHAAQRLSFSYVDEDGDNVQLSSDAELAYALSHFAAESVLLREKQPGNPSRVLRLSVALKPCALKNKTEEVMETSTSVKEAPTEKGNDNNSSKLNVRKKLVGGEMIALQWEREGVLHNLALSEDGSRVVAAKETPQSEKEVPLNQQWTVQRLKTKKTDGLGDEGPELFLFRSKAKASKEGPPQKEDLEESSLALNRKDNAKKLESHLRVAPDGRVDHKGGRGRWAQLLIEYHDDKKDEGTWISLRSVGHTLPLSSNNNNRGKMSRPFLGLIKDASGAFVASGGFANCCNPNTKLLVKFL